MPEIKPHEYTTQISCLKGKYHKCSIAPDTMFISCFITNCEHETNKIYLLMHCTN